MDAEIISMAKWKADHARIIIDPVAFAIQWQVSMVRIWISFWRP